MAPLRAFLAAALWTKGQADEIEKDGVSLLQALSVKGPKPSDKKSVSALLETAGNMLKNGATEDVIQFAQATLDEISGVVVPAIADASEADQRLLDRMYAFFEEALVDLEEGNREIFEMNSQRVSHSTAHKQCRDDEAVKCLRKVTCDYQLYDLWKIFVDEEEELREIEGRIDGHFCLQDETGVYIANGTTFTFRDTSVPHMTSFISQKIRVDIAEEHYGDFVPYCEENITILDEKTEDCDAMQLTLERSACSLAVQIRNVQAQFAEAWNQALWGYNTTVHEVKLMEIDRISEYRTLSVVQCLLDRTSERNGRPCEEETDEISTEITHCEHVRVTTDITWLLLNYHIVQRHPFPCPDRHQIVGRCLPEVPHYPCSSQYLSEEYGSLPDVPMPVFHSQNSHCNPRPPCEDCVVGPEPDIELCTSYWSLDHYELCADGTVTPRPVTLPPPVTDAPEPECGPLPTLTNAAWVSSTVGVLQYHCNDGFSFDGNTMCGEFLTVSCLPGGFYSEIHACLPIDDCLGHPCGAHGTCQDLHMDYTCNCEDGFEMQEVEGERICGNIDDCEGTMCGEAGVCVDLIGDYQCQCNEGWEEVNDANGVKICARKECGMSPEVANTAEMELVTGIYPWTRRKAVFGETVEYICASGYTTTGAVNGPSSFSITCQADQTYTAVLQCLPISCGAPENAGGATPQGDQARVYGEIVEYACPHGFGPEHFERMCMEYGDYSPAIACEPRACPPALVFPMAVHHNDQGTFFFGQTAEYTCQEGYTTDPTNPLARDFAVDCLADGWGVTPSCHPVECELNTDETHFGGAGSHTIEFGGFTILMCAEGYTTDGSAQGASEQFPVCRPDGVAEVSPCMPVRCSAEELEIALWASVQTGATSYLLGDSATYTCDDGYEVAVTGGTTFEVECLRSGGFSSMCTCRNIDDCEGHSCGSNGHCVDGINDYSCDCESGFEETVSESGEKMCGNIDDCGPNACGPNGACHDLVNGFTCECDLGYELQGEGMDQLCVPKECPIPNLPNTIAFVDVIYYSQTLFVECAVGHTVVGDVKNQPFFNIECSADGTITSGGSASIPQCTPVSCGTPPNVMAEQVEVREYYYGEVAVSACQGGEVEITHSCGPTGQFQVTSQFTTCQNSCGAPSLVAHSQRTDGAGAVVHPDSASYSCLEGYSTGSGSSFTQACRADGTFEPLPANIQSNGCQPIECDLPIAPVTWDWVSGNGFNTQGPRFLTCAPGYQSEFCGPGGHVEVTCNADGTASGLPTQQCYPIMYDLNGIIRNAVNPQAAMPQGSVMINGDIVTTGSNGQFNFQLPGGTHEYEISAQGFITITGTITISATSGQYLEVNMSPDLAFDEWRIVLSWSDLPRDLDSHIQFLGSAHWNENPWSCYEMMWNRRSTSCSGMSATLDVDDTNGYGPETTTLAGMTSYWGGRKIVYKVKNYSKGWDSSAPGWERSGATVQLYRGGAGLVHTFHADQGDAHQQHPQDTAGRCSGEDCFWTLFEVTTAGFNICGNSNCS